MQVDDIKERILVRVRVFAWYSDFTDSYQKPHYEILHNPYVCNYIPWLRAGMITGLLGAFNGDVKVRMYSFLRILQINGLLINSSDGGWKEKL